jgi:hypothetical protein
MNRYFKKGKCNLAGLSVPEAMRACKISFDESSDQAKQMAIRRSFAKATSGKLQAPPVVIDALELQH